MNEEEIKEIRYNNSEDYPDIPSRDVINDTYRNTNKNNQEFLSFFTEENKNTKNNKIDVNFNENNPNHNQEFEEIFTQANYNKLNYIDNTSNATNEFDFNFEKSDSQNKKEQYRDELENIFFTNQNENGNLLDANNLNSGSKINKNFEYPDFDDFDTNPKKASQNFEIKIKNEKNQKNENYPQFNNFYNY